MGWLVGWLDGRIHWWETRRIKGKTWRFYYSAPRGTGGRAYDHRRPETRSPRTRNPAANKGKRGRNTLKAVDKEVSSWLVRQIVRIASRERHKADQHIEQDRHTEEVSKSV